VSSAARDLLGADALPDLPIAQAMVHEAPPDPPHGPIRDALADDAAARVDRAVSAMTAAIAGYNDRLSGVLSARLRGPKARKGTRFWSDQVKSVSGVGVGGSVATRSRVETKALDGDYLLPDKTVDEIADAVRPVGLRIVADAASHVARSLGRPNVGLAAFDWQQVEGAVDSAVQQMLGVARRQAAMVRAVILDANSTAEDLDAVIDQVLAAARRGGNWTQVYGRTLATALAGDAALAAAKAMGVTHMQWISKRDPKVRPTHRVADGQERPIGWKYQVGAFRLRFPGDPEVLPEGIGEVANCFIGGTEVSAPDVEASFRAPYVGDVITIYTVTGRVLTGTPNHPVLTERGWVALGELHESDCVISARRGEQVGTGIDPDIQGAPATLEQIHSALSIAMVGHRIGRGAVNFYGDRPTGEVDVVAADRPLRFGRQPALIEQASERDFPGRREAGQCFPTRSDASPLPITNYPAASSGVSLTNQRGAAFTVQSGPASTVSVTAATGIDASFDQVPTNRAAVYTEDGSERLLRLACQVAGTQRIGIEHMEVLTVAPCGTESSKGLASLDQPCADSWSRYAELLADACRGVAGAIEPDYIVDVRRHPFSGHVYTLQTGTGVYTAEGIISKNCRCGLLFVKPLEGWSHAVELTEAGTPGAARQLLGAAPVGAVTNEDPSVGDISVPAVRVPADVVAYRTLDELPVVTPGQRISWPKTLALALGVATAVNAAQLAVAIPAGMVVGVAGSGAVVLGAGVALSVVSVTDGLIVAVPVAPVETMAQS